MKKCFILLGLLSINLVACNGGSGGSSSSSSDSGTDIVSLVPLNVTMNDINGNPISSIDVTKNNSHFEYKLTFTNPNSVTVSIPKTIYGTSPVTCDQNWANANGESQMPGLCSVTGSYEETTNSDDCNNLTSIPAGGSCSFYTLAYNDLNPTTQTSFSYPVAYYIKQTGTESQAGGGNTLYVQQCTTYQVIESGEYVTKYNCSNESKPGFANQFVSYTLNPTPTVAPYLGYLSMNGKWTYQCTDNLHCAKYQVTYESATNSLTIATTPSYTYTMPNIYKGLQQYPTYDGSTNWSIGMDTYGTWNVVNSNEPNKSYYIEGAYYASDVGGVMGLDNSFWVGTNVIGAASMVYNAKTDSFDATNIPPGLWGVDYNGTVITGVDTVYCATTTGDPMGYTLRPLLNYSGGEPNVISQVGGLYIQSGIPDLLYGGSGMYKIHTENGLCELHDDDFYISYGSYVYEGYALISAYVTQASNVYRGL